VPEADASCLCLDGDHLTHGSGGNFTFTQIITIIIPLRRQVAALHAMLTRPVQRGFCLRTLEEWRASSVLATKAGQLIAKAFLGLRSGAAMITIGRHVEKGMAASRA
jgi:hypothetical protein